MPRKEYQIKIKGGLDLSVLLGLGAEPLGQVTQNDIYLSGEITWRIREEGGQYIFAQKENDVGERAMIKDVSERIISKSEANRLIKERGILVTVFKKRILFRFRESVIAIDEVEFLGEFTEIRSTSENGLFEMLKILGLGEKEVFKRELFGYDDSPEFARLAPFGPSLP